MREVIIVDHSAVFFRRGIASLTVDCVLKMHPHARCVFVSKNGNVTSFNSTSLKAGSGKYIGTCGVELDDSVLFKFSTIKLTDDAWRNVVGLFGYAFDTIEYVRAGIEESVWLFNDTTTIAISTDVIVDSEGVKRATFTRPYLYPTKIVGVDGQEEVEDC